MIQERNNDEGCHFRVVPFNTHPAECTFMQNDEIKQMLADLIWLNALIATELIQVTENTSAILRKAPPPESCLKDHNALRATALSIAEHYHMGSALAQHLGKHQ
jgi:hypothetical protein